MGSQLQSRLSEAEYLALERRAPTRSEYLDGEVFAMAGASLRHNQICANVLAALHPQARAGGCEIYASDLRVRVERTGLFTYPDLVVVCGEPKLLDSEGDTLLNPAMIFEVLSSSTEAYDRGEKFAHYRTIPSLRDYVLISQERALVEHFTRQGDVWVLRTAEGAEASLELPSIASRLELAEAYRGFETLETDGAS